jgi:REP element-mobilizing transposase RayT
METGHKHLHRLPVTLPMEVTIIYFVTCCTQNRRQLFTNEAVVRLTIDELVNTRQRLKWPVGGVVVMPDHVHLFCSPPDRYDHDLSRFIGAWRSAVSRQLKARDIEAPVWQKSFFDHILRSDESYDNKWEYVRQNPDRAGLKDFQRWFEIDRLER